jgi:hypothetical protein
VPRHKLTDDERRRGQAAGGCARARKLRERREAAERLAIERAADELSARASRRADLETCPVPGTGEGH